MFKSGATKAALAMLATALLFFGAGKAFASISDADDPYSVNYFINANTGAASGPDTLRVVDPDPINDSHLPPACTNIFVFDSAQELQECCACVTTPAGRQDFNVNTMLTQHPASPASLPGGILTTGSIKIVKTNVGHCTPNVATGCPANGLFCDATDFLTQGGDAFDVCGPANGLRCPAPALFAWITHALNRFNSAAVSEAEFQSTNEGTLGQVPLPNGDLRVLQDKCSITAQLGGVCLCPPVP